METGTIDAQTAFSRARWRTRAAQAAPGRRELRVPDRERLWVAGRRGSPQPPISVHRSGGCDFVGAGYHRVSVARSLGMHAIDAEVTEIGCSHTLW